jgi:hypothetical protein
VEVVTDFNASAGSNLVLPLARHNFSIGARNFDACVKAGLVVSVGNEAPEANVGSSGTVVGALLSRVSVVGPSEGVGGEFGRVTDEGVLLLDTVPGLFFLNEIVVPDFVGEVSEVGVGGDKLLASFVFPTPTLTEDKNIVAKAEGVTEVSDGLEDDLGLISDGLVGRGAIVVPFGDVGEAFNLFGEGAALGAEGDAGTIKPNVLSNDGTSLIEAVESMSVLVVESGV